MKLFETDMDGEFKRREKDVSEKDAYSKSFERGVVMPRRRFSYEYNGLIWERLADKNKFTDGKKEMNYVKHLENITANGYTRSPTPKEYFAVAMQYYDNTLTSDNPMCSIAEDMINGDPEFFCCAMTRQNHHLIFYENIFNLDFLGDEYKANNPIWHHGEHGFSIDGLESGEFYSLNDIKSVNERILYYLYGKKYENIPSFVHDYRPTIYIPQEGELLIAGRGEDTFGVHGYYTAASRGVREK